MVNKGLSKTAEYRDINERAYDLLGELLLQQETEALLAEIEQEKVSGNTDAYESFSARQDMKNLKRIHRYFRLQRTRTFFRHTLPKIGQIAAILIAVITIAGGVAIATSHSIRVQVMKMLVQMEEQYTSLSLVEDTEASFEIPLEWTGEYYPSYIPESFEANVVISFPGNHMVEFFTGESATIRIIFSEYGDSTMANIDTENATVKAITIGNDSGFISIKDSHIYIYWDNGRAFFVLQTNGIVEDEAIRIAQSVMLVK
ncbi:MAG TPA: DUF4367 domain-containing protein [Candidatus Limiplasma sp.]|nr:DUF4367 domain-containing protein [Candidatus Limiplasma sp.]